MGWFSAGVDAKAGYENKNTNTNENLDYSGTNTGTTSAVLDPRWKTAYDAISKNLDVTGYTPDQRAAVDFAKGQLGSGSPVNTQVGATNTALGATNTALAGNTKALTTNNDALGSVANYFKNQQDRGSHTLGDLAAKAAAGVPGYESYAAPKDVTAQNVGTTNVDATSGAAYINDYSSPFTGSVVDTTLANYDRNTGRQLNALRASRDAGSAFGDRAAIADDTFLSDSAQNRANLEAQLREQGFELGANLGQNDANRSLSAGTTNASNRLAASSANAANNLQASQFNNNLLNQRQQFDVNAAYQGDASRDAAATSQAGVIGAQNATLSQISNNLKQSAGLSQQILDNVVTANGINTNAAQALFQSGQISQAQLQAILQAATTANGQTTTNTGSGSQRTVGHTGTDTISGSVEGKAGFI